jgi:hypothetical protein
MTQDPRAPLFLGLDFGSAFTRICSGRADNGRIERLGHLDYGGTPSHPSGIARDVARDSWLSGSAWESSLCSDAPLQLFPDPRGALHAALGAKNSVPITESGAFEATRRLFFRLTGDVLETERATGSGGAAVCVALGTSDEEKELLRRAIALPELAFISTPEAVLLGFDMGARMDGRARIIGVFDAGAGGSRCTLLEVRLRQGLLSTQVLADVCDAELGGNALDKRLFRRLLDKRPALEAAFGALEPIARGAAHEEALWQIRQMRVRLLDNPAMRGEVVLARLNGTKMMVDRQSLNAAVEDLTLSASRVLETALSRAGISAGKIAHLLPVGGLTRLSGIQKMLAMRVPQVETSPSILAGSTDLLAPARGAARFAAQQGAQNGQGRLLPLQSPAFGVALNGELDPILPVNTAAPLRRSKVYASGAAVASGVGFEIWSGFGRGLDGATKVGELLLEFKGEGWHFDEMPLRVSLELVAPGHLKAEVRPLDARDPSQAFEIWKETRPGVWQTA